MWGLQNHVCAPPPPKGLRRTPGGCNLDMVRSSSSVFIQKSVVLANTSATTPLSCNLIYASIPGIVLANSLLLFFPIEQVNSLFPFSLEEVTAISLFF